MKKMSIVCILVLLFLLGCSRASDTALSLKLDGDGNYTGFRNLPANYTARQAQKDGCYVSVDLKTFGGEEQWKEFIQDALGGKDASIRVVNVVDNRPYFQDLFYLDDYYRIFDSTSGDLQDYKFKYLLELKGSLPNAANGGIVTILTDDKNLTFNDVMWTFLSSDMNYSKSISPFKLVMIK